MEQVLEPPVFPVIKNLHVSEYRREAYAHAILGMVTRPALAEERTAAANQLIDLGENVDPTLDFLGRSALAAQVLAQEANLRYVRSTSEWTRLLNEAKSTGRHVRALTDGGDFSQAASVLIAVRGAALLGDVAARATVLNALATDAARRELEALRTFVLHDQQAEMDDPELLPAFDMAAEMLAARNESWWASFLEEADRHKLEFAGLSINLAVQGLSHKAAVAVGAKAGLAVSIWAVPIAAGIASWEMINDTTHALDDALLNCNLAKRLHAAPLERRQASLLDLHGRYAQFAFYESMYRALSTWGIHISALFFADIREVREHYATREARAFSVLMDHAAVARGAEVALLIDSSGSMSQNDPGDLRIAAARLFAERKAADLGVAVLDFDSRAKVLADGLSGGTASVDELNRAASHIDHKGGTDLGLALRKAADLLGGPTARLGVRSAVLLTDGKGEYDDEAAIFAARGWPVYTVGLTGAVDEALLSAIARQTGGEYFKAQGAADLQGLLGLVGSRYGNEGTLLLASDRVAPGEERRYAFDLDDAVSEILARLYWPGSDLDLVLTAPDGTNWDVARARRSGALASSATTYEQFRVANPMPGRWTATVKAVQVPANGEPFDLQIGGASPLRVDVAQAQEDTSTGTVVVPVRLRHDRGSRPRVDSLRLTVQPPSGEENLVAEQIDPFREGNLRLVHYAPQEQGDHLFRAQLRGATAQGSSFTRVQNRMVHVGAQTVGRNAGRVLGRFGGFVTISLGERNGLAPGMTVELLAAGTQEVIGAGMVMSVEHTEATVELMRLYGIAKADAGTPVRATRIDWMQEE